MKIVQFTCFEVMVPTHSGVIESEGINKPLHKLPVGASAGWSFQFDQVPKLILKMELEGGLIGWGECYRGHDWNMIQGIAERLLGMNIEALCLQRLPFTFCREYDGFECAIWDAYAKLHDMRVVDLLGGPLREKVKIGAWSSHRNVEEIGDLVAGYANMGYDCIKFKTDLEDDVVAWCQVIKETAPNMEVILDPNERWLHAADTRKRLDGLSEVGNVLCLEDPIPRWQLKEYAKLRNYSSVPIALHVSLPYILHGQRVKDAIMALKEEAVDGFNFNGGLAKFQQLTNVAAAAELPCWHGSELDLGILEAMYIHSSAAAPTCTWPGDIFGRLIRTHDCLKTPIKMEAPYAYLPEGKGLGVEPDEAAINEFLTDKKEFCIS